ncbi:bifunctional aminoglycoside phosphotransferase/ATP-binding protein [Wenzhouxiangella sp. XN24]|uniref:bifunctional aminoglycoside phosphotransferase/ATP-binding protein n=1 Tax=Wenzhouxiangella sp. XN24 TaxID=2713569 RepID=UPI0013ED8446|nr:bifunctional aminoglycoside phosphotransferase/ATP-binding protein [Wenzhouxiangella sp. XN24]NGX15751.1 AAA family ATPase [Wenzhouxiangella sp. XN24]
MIDGLCRPEAYPHPVDAVERVETHISWVFLAGEYAYKFKKPLDLGFLDFRERGRRVHYCREELRLNGRLAPDLYLEVVGARCTQEGCRIGPLEDDAEPAVRMRRFPAEAQLDRLLEAGRLDGAALEAFAGALAEFQRSLPSASRKDGYGDAASVARPALANFEAIPADALGAREKASLAELEKWTRARAAALAPRFDARLDAGLVREGHGDLHLSNLVMLDGRIAAFDGIEFDPALRWIDLQSEVAFLLMDLEARGRRDLGWRFYNAWLAAFGDHDGIALLPWYLVYRHLVRAKIAAIRLGQSGVSAREAEQAQQRVARHVRFAAAHAEPATPRLVLMHGASGSGKSYLARRLAPHLPAVWVRSDVERKRLHGLEPTAEASADLGAGLYAAAASARTYTRLAEIARTALSAGCSVVVDAAFLESERREFFLELGLEQGARPVVLACQAPPEVLRRRVATRHGDPSDAGLEVLEAQLARPIAIGPLESRCRMNVDTSGDVDPVALAKRLE